MRIMLENYSEKARSLGYIVYYYVCLYIWEYMFVCMFVRKCYSQTKLS